MQKELDYYRNLAVKHNLPLLGDTTSSKLHISPSQALEYFKKGNHLQLSGNYYNTCQRVYKEFGGSIEVDRFDMITRKHVSNFIIGMQGSKSRATRDNYYHCIRNVFKVMDEFYSDEVVCPEKDPTSGIKIKMTDEEKSLTTDNRELFLRQDDFRKWEEYRSDSFEYDYAHNVSLFQCYTGLSPAEVFAFNPDLHIITNIRGHMMIRIRRGKTKNNSGVYSETPLSPEIERLIGYFKLNPGPSQSFISRPKSYYQKLQKMSVEVGLNTQMTPHGGRHTFGFQMILKGFSMQAVSKMLGHASISTTERIYASIDWDHIEMEMNRIEERKAK